MEQEKIEICKHCGQPIKWLQIEADYIHTIKTWGFFNDASDWGRKNYNNGYYCYENDYTKSADPIK
jgi:hypothetical protein